MFADAMRIFRRAALAFPMALCLNASAADGELDPASLKDVKSLAVISLLVDVFEVSYVGATVFNNFHYFGQVDWWRINTHVSLVLGESLKRRGRFELKDIPYDRSALLKDALNPSSGSSAID